MTSTPPPSPVPHTRTAPPGAPNRAANVATTGHRGEGKCLADKFEEAVQHVSLAEDVTASSMGVVSQIEVICNMEFATTTIGTVYYRKLGEMFWYNIVRHGDTSMMFRVGRRAAGRE